MKFISVVFFLGLSEVSSYKYSYKKSGYLWYLLWKAVGVSELSGRRVADRPDRQIKLVTRFPLNDWNKNSYRGRSRNYQSVFWDSILHSPSRSFTTKLTEQVALDKGLLYLSTFQIRIRLFLHNDCLETAWTSCIFITNFN